MLAKDVSIIDYTTLDGKHSYEHCSHFTPNGKRYKLVEVTVDEHPETLTTLEDYEDAPAGTIVAAASRRGSKPFPMMKGSDEIWVMMKSVKGRFNYYMAGDKRQVLRWGWGE